MLWGSWSLMTMPRREDPEYTVRTCVITTSWPGVPVEKVEELITDRLEKAVDSIDDVRRVRSTTQVGLSTVYVDAEETVSPERIDNVWDKVRARVAQVEMPESGLVPNVNDEFGDTSILLLSVSQQPLPDEEQIPAERKYSLRRLDVISQQIADALKLLPGVARSDQYGVREEAVYIQTDPGTWSSLSLTTSELARLLQARNITATGGSIDTGAGRYSVRPAGEFNTVREIDSVTVGVGDDPLAPPVQLQELGLETIRGYEDPPRTICRFGDTTGSADAVIVALTMKSGSNIVDLCDAATARVREMQDIERSIPPDIAVTAVSDQSVNVRAKIQDVLWNVVGAILIVIAVVYLVVGFRSAAVMAANIPVVVVASIGLVTLFDVQLEQISLASIIIALGLLVDNAVQVCDQSRTNQMAGMNPVDATVAGSAQLSMPMLSGTATTVVAFLPMLVGLVGTKREFIYSLPVTLSVTLILSWLLAMTFCTVLAAWAIRPPADISRPSAPLPWLMDWCGRMFRRRSSGSGPAGRMSGGHGPAGTDSPAPGDNLISRIYRTVATGAIRLKFVTVGVSVALLAGALMLPVGSEFFPKDARDQFAVEVWLPENVSLQQTDAVARQVEELIRQLSPGTDSEGQPVERLKVMRTTVGGGGARWYLGRNPESIKPNFAEILVRTSDPRLTTGLAADVGRVAREGDADMGIPPVTAARVIPRELALGPAVDAPIGLRIYGTGFADIPTMRRLAAELRTILEQMPGTWDHHDTWGADAFQLLVDTDPERASLAGVSSASVASTLNAYFNGHKLTSFREGDHQVPVYLRLSPENRQDLSTLRSAFVEGANGKVPLESIATVSQRWDPAKIERRELNRMIEVRARVNDGVLANDVVTDLMQREDMQQFIASLPAGFWFEIGGEMYESRESQEQMSVCLGLSVLLMVLILVLQYNGWGRPTIILATLPMALIGALPGLYVTGYPLGFMPQLGILSLFGIVLNTAIIFMEFADLLAGEAIRDSDGSGPVLGLTQQQFRAVLVEAGRQRLLPIFLTTATTVGGLLPLALDGGPLWEGMAWCMIFGLLVATLLTLLVIPAMYAIFVEYLGMQIPVPAATTALAAASASDGGVISSGPAEAELNPA
ncbi:MAG: efflux RND transporter permease subunit [Planctomycetaceae bacterium]|nr:efflux RND transporter permease subunit [Planctomycetaceae bacterium]